VEIAGEPKVLTMRFNGYTHIFEYARLKMALPTRSDIGQHRKPENVGHGTGSASRKSKPEVNSARTESVSDAIPTVINTHIFGVARLNKNQLLLDGPALFVTLQSRRHSRFSTQIFTL